MLSFGVQFVVSPRVESFGLRVPAARCALRVARKAGDIILKVIFICGSGSPILVGGSGVGG